MDTDVAQAEVRKLRAELARLQRQLQAEKADNTGNLWEYHKQRESCGNRDNDETSLPIKSVCPLPPLYEKRLTSMQTRIPELSSARCSETSGEADPISTTSCP